MHAVNKAMMPLDVFCTIKVTHLIYRLFSNHRNDRLIKLDCVHQTAKHCTLQSPLNLKSNTFAHLTTAGKTGVCNC